MINVDGLNQMVKESSDYKVVVKGGLVHVVPASAVDKIDFSEGSASLKMSADIIPRWQGQEVPLDECGRGLSMRNQAEAGRARRRLRLQRLLNEKGRRSGRLLLLRLGTDRGGS